ncbi:MAG: amidohydrolase family protein [Hyphomonadaceae bacterium]|nr:amidohydrolase family protein [Hyphomonadaceae bacterium]
MAEFDVVIRNGTLADGTGGALRDGDVGLVGDRIAAIGPRLGRGREEIDAKGCIVTPGFVDVHTHYDGQATWDSRLEPSTRHGVTTAVTGNCGVGFAPCRPQDRDALIRLMEGVEDIPGAALHEGLQWDWESFPDYLDALARRPRDCDVAAMAPHGALRVFAMGARGIAREPATDDDIALMRALLREALDAGAIGLGTSRTIAHRTADGDFTPMYGALRSELAGVTQALNGRGVFQMVSDFVQEEDEFGILEDAARNGASAASFSLLQADPAPDKWRSLLDRTERAAAQGLPVRAQVIARPVGVLMGLEASMHPFSNTAAWREIAARPLSEKVARMRDPAFRARLLNDEKSGRHQLLVYFRDAWSKFFPLGDPPVYAPGPERSIAAMARAQGRAPEEVAYELLLENDGRAFIYLPLFNYTRGDLSVVEEMLAHPLTVPGLGDGGAHVGAICDGSATTYLLMHWVRDRGDIPLQSAVEMLTRRSAALVGLHDRGVLAPGRKADLNVIDLDALAIAAPRIAYDLPAGGKRLTQGARGYRATVLSGVIAARDDAPTGALPGRLVRGRQAA